MAERRLAVLFGSGSFSRKLNEFPDLRCPPNDVKGFAEVLRDSERGGFIVDELVDKPWYEVMEKINSVLREATYEDLVLIYYSGHGKLNLKGRLHLATPETTASNLEATSISVDYLRTFIDGTMADRVILILDCCFSGKIGDAWLKSSISDVMQTTFESGKGIYILTASTGLETAQEKEGEKYSVFTKSLIEGLRTGEADSGQVGQISMEDIYKYVKNEVKKVSPQTPMKWHFNGSGDILIARSGRVRRIEIAAKALPEIAAKALPEIAAKPLPEFAVKALLQKRPASINDFSLPRTGQYFPSPSDWRGEVLYFILLDRFSDGHEDIRPLIDRSNLKPARSVNWKWDRWAQSGAERWQGGTLRGVRSKLDYLKNLGVTTLWLSPVFKQRGHLDTYDGYCVQDFLDVDPHFGTRQDLVDLVREAHGANMRVILSVIISHSGPNWLYPPETPSGPSVAGYTPDRYPFGNWRGCDGQPIKVIENDEDGVWPVELQNPDIYIRSEYRELSPGNIDDTIVEHKRSDLLGFRKFDLSKNLGTFVKIYEYWIALTDCDGFYIDKLNRLNLEEARGYINAIKEYAARLGKKDFFMMGEIGGGDYNEDRYQDVVSIDLNAALDIGETRIDLKSFAKGLDAPSRYFNAFDEGRARLGSQRNIGGRRVSILDDSDHVFGDKLRFSTDAVTDRHVVVAVAVQMLTLGIPCIYYGTEQCLCGPEAEVRGFLPEWGRSNRYLREAMFGPNHPRSSGRSGIPVDGLDSNLPGFGAFGTSGYHCFDQAYPAFLEIASLINIRQSHEALQSGRQYLRETRTAGKPFAMSGGGELIAWSRILGDGELLCIINSDWRPHSADVAIDRDLNAEGSQMTVMFNKGDSYGVNYEAPYPVGSRVQVKHDNSGIAYVEIRDLQPLGVLVLSNYS